MSARHVSMHLKPNTSAEFTQTLEKEIIPLNTGSAKSLDSRAWRELYKAALFEVGKTKLPERIAQAEKALALRARELFHVAGDNIEEGQAMDDATYALHALQNTSQTLYAASGKAQEGDGAAFCEWT